MFPLPSRCGLFKQPSNNLIACMSILTKVLLQAKYKTTAGLSFELLEI